MIVVSLFWESTEKPLFMRFATLSCLFFFFIFFIWLFLVYFHTWCYQHKRHKGPMPVALLVHVTWALGFGPSSVLLSCVSSMSCRTTQCLDEEVAWNRGLKKCGETCEFFMIENPLELELCWVAFDFTVLASNSSHTRGCLGISVQMREINIRKSLALRALEGSI